MRFCAKDTQLLRGATNTPRASSSSKDCAGTFSNSVLTEAQRDAISFRAAESV